MTKNPGTARGAPSSSAGPLARHPTAGLVIALLSLLMVQLGLGFASWVTRVEWGRDAVQPETAMVWITVAHVSVGALLLATAVVLAIQAWRHVAIPTAERIPNREPRPVTI